MNRLIRKAILFAVGALLVAGAANASAPNSANSTQPIKGIQLVSTSGGPSPSSVDQLGIFEFRIVDNAMNPINGAEVVVDFSGCPHIRVGTVATAGVNVNCVNKTATAFSATDATKPPGLQIGWVKFGVTGQVDQATYLANANFPGFIPAAPGPCPGPTPVAYPGRTSAYAGCGTVKVTVAGFGVVAFTNFIVAAYDHNGAAGLDGGDLSFALADRLSGLYRERSDYDASFNWPNCANTPGQLTGGDLSVALTVRLAGGSSGDPVTPCVP